MAEPEAVRTRMRGIPGGIRIALAFGVVSTSVYAAVYFAARTTEPGRADAMLRMYVFTMAAGRETAMFDALHNGLPASWTFGLSVLDDVGSLMLALCFAWFFVNFLKRSPRVRWAL